MLNDKLGVKIVGTGSFLPEKVVTNLDLENYLDTTDTWIRTKTGIKERRIASENEATSDLGAKAALKALSAANIQPEELDLVILATSSPDVPMPATACILQDKIGAYRAAAFDVSAVCAGFIFALSVGYSMIKTNNLYKNVLIVASETYSRILNWSDRSTCVYFGDGAGAAVLQPSENTQRILGCYLKTDGSNWRVIKIPAGGSCLPTTTATVEQGLHNFQMDGPKVWDFVMESFPDAVNSLLDITGLSLEEIDWVIPHQANSVMIEACAKKLGLPMEKVFLDLDIYGNIAGASTAVALDDAVKRGVVQKGDKVLMVAFGAGLAWGAIVFEW